MRLSTYIAELPKGGKAALARRIGIAPAYLYQVATGIRRVPAERVLDIYRATGGAVTPHELRPDLYPDPDWRPRLDSGKEVAA